MDQLFYELHEALPQQGPGSAESTLLALSVLERHRPGLRDAEQDVLDIGCGPGRQTLDLLRALPAARITATDNWELALQQLRDTVAGEPELAQRLDVQNRDMAALPFADASFDLIWSEGAIYIMGFGEGLNAWKRMLRPGGMIAVTEISWLTPSPPAEAARFWQEAYPGMADIPGNLGRMEKAGFAPLGAVVLPASDWWAYYEPLSANARAFSARHAGDETAAQVLSMEQAEVDLYAAHGHSYSYVFYLGQLST